MDNKDLKLDEKDIYKLFNDVKIEESEFGDMGEKVSYMQKQRIKKRLNKKINEKRNNAFKYGAIAVSISMACLIGVGVKDPAFAKDIPVVGSILETLNNRFGGDTKYAKFSNEVNKTVTDKGISLTINEVLADDSKLVIGYTIKSDKEIKDLEMFSLSQFLRINGKHLDSNYGSSNGKYIDKYTYIGSEEVNTKIPKKDEFKIDFNVKDILKNKGHWKFAFTISKKDLMKNSKVFSIDKKIKFPDCIVNIDKVTFSPIDTKISVSGKYNDKKREGNRGILDYDYWVAFDDNNVELIPEGLGGGTSNLKSKTFNTEMTYKNLKSVPKFITIIPCKIYSSGGYTGEDGKTITIEGRKNNKIAKPIKNAYPIELMQGKFGKVIIKKIDINKDKTTVKFNAVGKAPYFQAKGVYLEDSKGNRVNYYNNYNIRRSEDNPTEFTIEFEALDLNKNYNIVTEDFNDVELREDLKFHIKF